MAIGVTSIKPSAPAPPAFSRWIVSAYRLLGFVVLVCILVGIVSYIGLNLTYFVHRAWVAPIVISPTDPRVLDLSSRMAHESWMREQVEASRIELTARIDRARRTVEAEKQYQESFQAALEQDANARRVAAWQLGRLHRQYAEVKKELQETSTAFSKVARDRSAQEFQAKLIDEDAMLARTQKLAEMSQSNLSLDDRGVEVTQRLLGSTREASVLERLAKQPKLGAEARGLSYEGVNIAKQFQDSLLAVGTAEADAAAAEKALSALDKAVERYDHLIKTLDSASLMRAASHRLNLAFVPYDNQNRAQPGRPVFECVLQLLVCRRVGQIKTVLDGEVMGKHPVYGTDLRGEYVELEVEGNAMHSRVLHVGRPPLLL
ncbi:MAG: hypothetical protein ACOY0T_20740 [Myxococcota bacterium]